MNSRSAGIPAPAVRRLSLYLRQLEAFQARNCRTVSSKQLGEALHLTDAQVRKDLAYFGQFGHPGIGYRVSELITRVRRILGTDKVWNTLLVGAGNLGRALVSYRGFARKGFRIVAVFDNDPRKVGSLLLPDGSLAICASAQMPEVVAHLSIQLGIIAVPADAAQAVAEQMIASGIRGILNFAPASLRVPDGVAVSGVDLAVNLEQLSFQLGGTVG
jgi:redox-sensing transcriptional repressor